MIPPGAFLVKSLQGSLLCLLADALRVDNKMNIAIVANTQFYARLLANTVWHRVSHLAERLEHIDGRITIFKPEGTRLDFCPIQAPSDRKYHLVIVDPQDTSAEELASACSMCAG